MKIFGERLKELRIEKGLKQSEVEKNQREPSFDLLVDIAKYFNTSLDYLFGLID